MEFQTCSGKGVNILIRGKDRDLDITKNIKLVEWLKSEMLTSVADLFKLLVNGVKISSETLADCIANIIIVSYLLGKRLGVHFSVIDEKVEEKIRLGILEEHDVEKYYGDLSDLSQHIKNSRE